MRRTNPSTSAAARRALVLVPQRRGDDRRRTRTIAALTNAWAFRLPSVIRLLEYRRIPHQTRALSRKNILLRDRNTCQYCGEVLPASETHARPCGPSLTWRVQHVGEPGRLLPLLQTAEKGNRFVQETEMKLLREPRTFSLHTSRHLMRMIGRFGREMAEISVLLTAAI